ncbi:MAG: hypothetical protein HY828_18840 [Actinobacteria bacterium]|nr:hypothetical protein [Actinomycetota bacterium]
MPTGPLHDAYTNKVVDGEIVQSAVDCRCMIGEVHETEDSVDADAFYGSADALDDDDDDDGEALNVHDAADIWLSSGMDEDSTFGFSDDELRRAAGMD